MGRGATKREEGGGLQNGRGGGTKWEGGKQRFTPRKGGGGGKSKSHLKGWGDKTSFEVVLPWVVLTWELEVLAILMRAQQFQTVLPCLEAGGRGAIFPFCSPPPPPLPVINDRSVQVCTSLDFQLGEPLRGSELSILFLWLFKARRRPLHNDTQ